MTIAAQLAAALQERGITQAEAARHLGVTPGTVSRMLSGARTLSTVDAQKLATLAQVPLSEICRRAEMAEAA